MVELTPGLAAPLGAYYDGNGINFTLFLRMPRGLSCACSMRNIVKHACRCLPAAVISGMDICQGASWGSVMVFGCMARLSRILGCVLTPTSCCSIRRRGQSKGRLPTM